MTNPWLWIPLGDYEGHMSRPDVRQLRALSDLFKRAVELARPKSVAILGVAGGNGLEHLADAGLGRIVAIDINMEYLEQTRQRFKNYSALELHCADLTVDRLRLQPVDLVHAALIFEHAGTENALENAVSLVGRHGRLSIVLQLPTPEQVPVALSTYASMQALRDHFTFVDRDLLHASLEDHGFINETEHTIQLPGNKAFWHGTFARSSA
jgi:SAM-dependent methyltransferase